MKLPNFFIVGAPKCGTTAMSEYLRTHPQIFMSEPKEPHFFATDMPRYRYVTTLDDYSALFGESTEEHLAVGEASVFYLYSSDALKEIHSHAPAARLIVMLRNPIDLAVSMHAQALLSRDESVVDFEAAWNLRQPRMNGEAIPKHCRDIKVLLYDQLACLGAQLARLLELVPSAQVRWWFYDDFRLDTGRIYKEVLEFLNVPDDGRREFPRVNARRKARSQSIAQFTQKTPELLVRNAMRLKKCLGIERWGLLERVRELNFKAASPHPSLSRSLKREMRDYFAPDVARLSELTGRDLSHWLDA